MTVYRQLYISWYGLGNAVIILGKSKKTPQNADKRALVINHRFLVSELLFEH